MASAGTERRRRWEVADVDPEVVASLESRLGLLPTTARVLAARGIAGSDEAQAFLEPGLERLHSPFEFVQMEAAVDRLLSALRRGERIVVHGDYDVDGVTGTVVLVTVLRHLGGDVAYLVPHRIDHGYGLQPGGVDRAEDLGADLLLAVDCGVTALDAAGRARELGIDLIVADHHQPGDSLPEALAILNPCLPDSGYPEQELAAVGVAFKLARAVLCRHRGKGLGTALLKLVAIGTVADMVPLTGENRVIAHYGLATLTETTNPGLRALLELSGVRQSPVSAGDVSFRVAPRINAIGRLGDATEAVEMFLTADRGRARRLAQRLHETNSRRRRVEQEVLEAALEQAPAEGDAVVVVAGEGWHRGVIGIVASRLVETWGRPAVVLSVDGERAYGSARSIPGYDMVGALHKVAPLLSEYGGHRQAAGLELPAADVDELREALAVAGADELSRALERAGVVRCDAELEPDVKLRDLTMELERLAPFGVGNPRPRLRCRGLELLTTPSRLKERHLKLVLAMPDGPLEAVGWRLGDLVETLKGPCIDAVATLRLRRWNGRLDPQLELVEVVPAGSDGDRGREA